MTAGVCAVRRFMVCPNGCGTDSECPVAGTGFSCVNPAGTIPPGEAVTGVDRLPGPLFTTAEYAASCVGVGCSKGCAVPDGTVGTTGAAAALPACPAN